jgi:NHL repeat
MNHRSNRYFNGAAMLLFSAPFLLAQASYKAPNEGDVPTPYKTITGWAQLPDARKWGSTAAVGIGPDGNLWTYDRCGANDCEKSDLDPVLEFDRKTGKNLAHFGKGLFVQPHGLYVDRQGNVWVTDDHAAKDKSKGLQVFKFSPDGKILMTLGQKGKSGLGPDIFGAPTGVVTAPNGDIFVTDGHPGCNCEQARVVKFDKNGKYLMEFAKKGTGPGELDGPHAIAMDSRGRLFVADRSNNRLMIFDQNGKFIADWRQFGRPSGLYITPDDVLYVTDSESQSDTPGDPSDLNAGFGYNPGVHRGIRVGRIKDGKVTAFIPDPHPGFRTAQAAATGDRTNGRTSFSDGVAADSDGNVYGAEVGPMDLKKYVKVQ